MKKATTKKTPRKKKTSPQSVDPKLIPGPDTPGFTLASPRSFHVWLALLHHAQKSGHGVHAQKTVHGVVWTVTQLATDCGCTRNTAGAAIAELASLGWIRTALGRHVGGEYSGFEYCLREPPSILSEAMRRRQQEKISKIKKRAVEAEITAISEDIRSAKTQRERTKLAKRLESLEKQLEEHVAGNSLPGLLAGK